MLINLTDNAIKFTKHGGISLEVRLHFAVRDNGLGIAPDKQAAIFEPFVQAEASTTRRFGGTGLGLAISRRLIQAMGGDIELTSSLGQGSTFAFSPRLPPATPVEQAAPAPRPPRPPARRPQRPWVRAIFSNITTRPVARM